jgi:hypothetical protein
MSHRMLPERKSSLVYAALFDSEVDWSDPGDDVEIQ